MKRIAILKVSFPKVMILWAKSAKESARIISRLANRRVRLDLARAERLGKNAKDLRTEEVTDNYSPLEILMQIEGVTSEIVNKLSDKVANIYELALLTEDKLKEIVGEAGTTIYNFIHKKIDAQKSNVPKLN